MPNFPKFEVLFNHPDYKTQPLNITSHINPLHSFVACPV